METHSTIAGMRSACANLRGSRRRSLGLVPTMGALHAGHVSLLRASRQACDLTAVSIFVNPTQFGPNEDLDRYPRTFAEDCVLLEREGVDLLFAPTGAEMYPTGGLRTSVEVSPIGDRLDGQSRPGHFRGVATVVAKLFGIVSPDVAFFGQKDAAQVAVLRAMVADLNFDIDLRACPTVREPDGLALSSRNRNLSPAERSDALALSAALGCVQDAFDRGVFDPGRMRDTLRQRLSASPALRIDYADLVDPDTLEPVAGLAHGALVAVAASVGSTRLIDNIVLSPAVLGDAD